MASRRIFAAACPLAAALFAPVTAAAQTYDGDEYFHAPTSRGDAARSSAASIPSTPAEPRLPELVAPPFGAKGEWVVSGSSSLGASSQTFASSSAVFASATFSPTVDWFVAKNVSLGFVMGAFYGESKGYGADGSLVDTRTASVQVGPRVGVNLPIGRSFSLWPSAAIGLEWLSQTESVVSGASDSVTAGALGYPKSTELGPWIALDVALLWHVAPHLFVGVVPGIFHGFGTVQGGPEVGGQETHVSGGFLLGGWFGGPPATTDGGAAPPDAGSGHARRFGDADDLVLSSELSLGGHWNGYAGTRSSSSSGYATAGLDYFPDDHFSLGGAVSGSLGGSTGIDATNGATVTAHSLGVGVYVRTGVDIPIGKYLSFWPRVSLGYATQTLTETEGIESQEVDKSVSLGLYAPVLVHPATHFFVGFGPSVAHDLSHSVVVTTSNDAFGAPGTNISTTVGAGLIVGGWL